MGSIFEKSMEHFEKNLPFVIYCKPNSEDLIAFFQQDKKLHFASTFSEKGFVFADFLGKQFILFPENECKNSIEKIDSFSEKSVNSAIVVSKDGKEAFESLVQKGIDSIEKGIFQKVVLSRKETVHAADFNFLEVFMKMLSAYPTAFRYVWFHPEIGLWLGASPEQLLKIENTNFKTVALAGTQKYAANSEAVWHEKEKQEQQFVTDFIVQSLQSEVFSLEISNPYTFQAANLLHIKTDLSGTLNTNFNLKNMLEVLHPTPAICGLPKQTSKAFILANEGYDRKFYAGFLGELNWNSSTGISTDSDLFVNLRCMEIQQNQVHLYIGCGITKDSNPEKEYLETANKAMTMKQILN